jgi:hypothetical protein
MRRLVKLMIAPLLALGFAAGAQAQSENDPNGLLAFSLWGLNSSPDTPRDFENVVFLIIYGGSETDDPYMLNDLNFTFESTDDTVDALPL